MPVTPEKCPSCGTRLKPEMTACPNCPMSFPEDDAPAGFENPFRQSPYFQFLLPALFFGGIAWGVWALASGYMRLGEENFAKSESLSLSKEKEYVKGAGAAMTMQGLSTATAKSAAAGAPDAEAAAPEEAPSGGEVLIISRVPEAAAVPPRRAARRAKEWRLRGTVYDLVTLMPLSGATLQFRDEESGRTAVARTDSAGRYRTALTPLDGRGYDVSLSKTGYAPNYLDPAVGGVGSMSEARRRELASDLSRTLAPARSALEPSGAAPLVTDFYLAPATRP